MSTHPDLALFVMNPWVATCLCFALALLTANANPPCSAFYYNPTPDASCNVLGEEITNIDDCIVAGECFAGTTTWITSPTSAYVNGNAHANARKWCSSSKGDGKLHFNSHPNALVKITATQPVVGNFAPICQYVSHSDDDGMSPWWIVVIAFLCVVAVVVVGVGVCVWFPNNALVINVRKCLVNCWAKIKDYLSTWNNKPSQVLGQRSSALTGTRELGPPVEEILPLVPPQQEPRPLFKV